MIMDNSILFGGWASGPARNASMTIVNMSVVMVERAHKMDEDMDSGTGYETMGDNDVSVC